MSALESTSQCKLYLASGMRWSKKWERFQQLLSEYKEAGTLTQFLRGEGLTEIQTSIFNHYVLGRGSEWTIQ